MSNRDWRISDTLGDVESRFHNDPDFTLQDAFQYAKLQGFREDELWKIQHLYEVLLDERQ